MKKRISNLVKDLFHKRLLGGGELYTLVLLGMVAAASYLVTGGLMPNIEQNPEDVEHVQIDDTTASSDKDNLQLVNIGIKADETPGQESPTPTDEPTPTEEPTTTVGPGTPTSTPRPTRTPTPSRTPTPTPPNACLNKTAITLLLDVSTSMENGDKLRDLNEAMLNFVGQLNNNTVIGAVQFAGAASFPNSNSKYVGTSTLINYKRWGPNKTDITKKLTSLHTYTTEFDGTYIRNAFYKAIDNIKAAKIQYQNQGYKFVTVIFTDGVPETQNWYDSPCEFQWNNPGDLLGLCFAEDQDPRYDLTDTKTGMRSLVSKVYAVGLYNGERELQAIDEARQLLSDIASRKSYATDTSDSTALTKKFGDIISSVCK